MKAYIEFIGNEDRQPKAGERFEDDNGNIVVACYDHEEIRRIVTRKQIEIQDGMTQLNVYQGSDTILARGHIVIPIPHPKVKVKKWIWYLGTLNTTTTSQWSEEEVVRAWPGQKFYHRIDETMVEVEE